jgi:hypothetical protein
MLLQWAIVLVAGWGNKWEGGIFLLMRGRMLFLVAADSFIKKVASFFPNIVFRHKKI